jgi:hypothetical protein
MLGKAQGRIGRSGLATTIVAGLAAAGLALAEPAPAAAWSPATQLAIAREAAHLAPPDLAQLIERHKRDFAAGVTEPFSDGDPGRHVKNPDGSGSLDRVIAAEVEAAVEAIRDHHPFAEVVHRLGTVAHFLADANNPLEASAADPYEDRYFADYLHYAESALPRFPLIFYGLEPVLDGPRDVEALVARTLARSRQLYPLVGDEYRRVGFLPGIQAFDDRSTAFGVASLTFSHAVNDVAVVLRYVWLRAGGADPRAGIPVAGSRLLWLPRATAGR